MGEISIGNCFVFSIGKVVASFIIKKGVMPSHHPSISCKIQSLGSALQKFRDLREKPIE